MEVIKLDPFEKQLVDYAEEIVHYLQKSGANQQEAKDVAQDVLLKMLESDLLLPQEKMRSWMYRVAVRKYIDSYRRNQRYQDIIKNQFFIGHQRLAFEDDAFEELYLALEKLPEKFRKVIDLYYFNDFTVKEIASILDISQSKVKIDLLRGRNKIKEYLESVGYHNDPFK